MSMTILTITKILDGVIDVENDEQRPAGVCISNGVRETFVALDHAGLRDVVALYADTQAAPPSQPSIPARVDVPDDDDQPTFSTLDRPPSPPHRKAPPAPAPARTRPDQRRPQQRPAIELDSDVAFVPANVVEPIGSVGEASGDRDEDEVDYDTGARSI